MAKSKEKLIAQKLRKQGKSMKVIAKKLMVSTSSVSLWCKDIILSPDQIAALEKNAHDPFYGKRMKNVLRQKREKETKIKRLHKEGYKKISILSKKELFLVGVTL